MEKGTLRPIWTRTIVIVLLLAAAISIGALKKGKPPAPHEAYGGRAELVIKDVQYATAARGADKLKLDVYSNPHQGLWPAVVLVHGGAWVGGDKTMDNKVYLSKVLAANGYVVFNINYRLVPTVHIKEQVEDCRAAVIWVKSHAREYGADPERVGLMGASAGGHLGALIAWANDDAYFKPTGATSAVAADYSVKVAALYYPVIDFDRSLHDLGSFLGPLGGLIFTGKVGKAYQQELQHISPMYHIKPGIAPTIFLTGDADSLKLYPQSVEYTAKLKAIGIDSELFTAPGRDHGFTWNYWEPESVASGQAMVKFLDKYLKSGVASSPKFTPEVFWKIQLERQEAVLAAMQQELAVYAKYNGNPPEAQAEIAMIKKALALKMQAIFTANGLTSGQDFFPCGPDSQAALQALHQYLEEHPELQARFEVLSQEIRTLKEKIDAYTKPTPPAGG